MPIVEMPAIPHAPPAEKPSNISRAGARARILVVDDNNDASCTLTMLLQSENYIVRTAANGEDAVALALAFNPDIIFMDIGMPVMDGYEATKRIRENTPAQRPWIVAFTGWGQESDRRRAKEAGMDRHLVKPVDPDTLLQLAAELDAMRGQHAAYGSRGLPVS